MKILLCSIDSKYIHRSLSVYYLNRALSEYCKKPRQAEIIEWTVNNPPEELLGNIINISPDILGISCYIWNIEYILETVRRLKLAAENDLLPGTRIVLGGPEVSFRAGELMEQHSFIDYIISGEGERPFALLADKLSGDVPELTFDIPGLWRREKGKIITSAPKIYTEDPPSPFITPPGPGISGDAPDSGSPSSPRIPRTRRGLVYIETSRGCPFSCAFCLSGAEENVRFFELERVKRDIIAAANGGAGTVKFVDRTFNCNPERAYTLFEFILKNHGEAIPRDLCFHFEVGADLFDERTLSLLEKAPAGLFQLEAGIQSFNPGTLNTVSRKTDPDKLENNLRRLRKAGNIHLHADLIAGLPREGYKSFAESFNRAFALRPHTLQLGFLKLLHGSALRRNAGEAGCEFSEKPPYEIISGNSITQNELKRLRAAGDALEKIYNSGRFHHTLTYTLNKTGTPAFSFFENISVYFEKRSVSEIPVSLDKYSKALYDYISELPGVSRQAVRNLMVLDRLTCDGSGFIPGFLRVADPRYKHVRQLAKSAGEGCVGAAILYGFCDIAVCADYKHKNPVTGRYKIKKIQTL